MFNGNQIRIIRTFLGMSQTKLAERSRLGVNLIASIEHGRRRVTMDLAISLRSAFEPLDDATLMEIMELEYRVGRLKEMSIEH